MNDRIKQLLIQSEVFNKDGTVLKDVTGYELNKFADLIVRECANHCDLLLDHKISSEWSRGTHDCSRAIKKHFGVE
jgi:hypothetical protein